MVFVLTLFTFILPNRYLGAEETNKATISDTQKAEIEKLIDAKIEKASNVKLSGELWLYCYSPAKIAGVNSEDQFNMDYLSLTLDKEEGNYGFHSLYNIRDERRFGSYAFSQCFLMDTYIYAKTPAGKLSFGKVFTDFGYAWDHTWYGCIPCLKGFMYDVDWGTKLTNEYPLNEKTKLAYSLGYFNRSDSIDGASCIEAFDIPEYNSPEFGVNTPGTSTGDRKQKKATNLRLSATHNLNNNTSGSVGLSFYKGKIEYTALDSSEDEHDYELDVAANYKSCQLLLETIYYDRGNVREITIPFKDFYKGNASLAEIRYEFYNNEKSTWCKSLAAWINYSVDKPDEGRESTLTNISIGGNLASNVRWILEHIDWKMKKYETSPKAQIDKGLYLGIGYSY